MNGVGENQRRSTRGCPYCGFAICGVSEAHVLQLPVGSISSVMRLTSFGNYLLKKATLVLGYRFQ